MNNFTVDILTPSKVIVKDAPAEDVLIPTLRGQIEVKKDHTHIVEKLNTGIISVFGGADDPDRHFFVSTGVCKVLNNKITILANTSEEDLEVDSERAELALNHANEKLSGTLTDDEIEKFRRKAERAALRIQLSKTAKK
ncbi:ATP synthase F1 subunit epsilon [Bacteriovorax sp. Seq25_V]|uniref:ATP synthase F1 subunit epsilon n=1 Tax=Bacteriovorax sp. Seq25_V TaxID=1201288 RepID=UPI00038A017E|nr:ATP synthase F1 subunit epsilon [Bacteriovorax sp. Seq25_V]EQC43364.1 ATP synthase F1, epsilon subunit [Bacteriovorax sp. Seq25_V]